MNDTKKLLFVCTGNICRSPLAHAVFEKRAAELGRAQQFEVESAGTHSYHVGENADSRMRATAAAHGVPFSHPARHISRGDLSYYDYIFVMDSGHVREVRQLAGSMNLEGKLRMFREFDPKGSARDDVPDPYYGGSSGFENVYNIVERTTDEILEALNDGRL